MFNKELVSIVMPSYNSSKYILKSIQSVLEQSYQNWELIIVDDCSKDNTKEILQSIDDPRINVIFLSSNVGAGLARNEGIKSSKGQFLAFLDSDDIWSPEKLTVQYAFMLKNQCAISFTSYSFIDESDKLISGKVNAVETLDLNSYMQTTGIGLSTSVINRDIVKDVIFDSMRMLQDTKLWIDFFLKGYTAYGIPQVLVFYRKRQGQISGNKVNAAYKTFRLYWSFKKISIFDRLYNFCCYAYNGIRKRSLKNNIVE